MTFLAIPCSLDLVISFFLGAKNCHMKKSLPVGWLVSRFSIQLNLFVARKAS